MNMMFGARVLCEQCALILLIVVVVENMVLRDDETDYQQGRDSMNEVVPPPIEVIEDGLRGMDIDNDSGQDAVPVDIAAEARKDGLSNINHIMRINKTQEPGLPSAEGQGRKVEAGEGEDSSSTKKSGNSESNVVESWCVIWYLGAFGSLVCFFLIITCTELFFGNPLYRDNNLNAFVQSIMSGENKSYVPETPPPPYHLFAPPDYYETIQKTESDKRKSLDVFVVPVHAGKCSSEPPRFEEATRKMVEDKLSVVVVAGKSNPVE